MTIVGNMLNVARQGVSVLKNKSRGIAVAGIVTLGTVTAQAQTTPSVDLSPVTDGISDAKVAMVGIAAAVIGAGIAAGAIKWGGRWAVGLFKIFTR